MAPTKMGVALLFLLMRYCWRGSQGNREHVQQDGAPNPSPHVSRSQDGAPNPSPHVTVGAKMAAKKPETIGP